MSRLCERGLTRATLERVDALPPPADYQLDAKEFTALMRRTFKPVRDYERATRDGDAAAAGRAAAKILAYSLPASEIASDLDVMVCLPEESR